MALGPVASGFDPCWCVFSCFVVLFLGECKAVWCGGLRCGAVVRAHCRNLFRSLFLPSVLSFLPSCVLGFLRVEAVSWNNEG